MRTLPKDGGESSSIWLDVEVPHYDRYPDLHADFCIIGAGIAGLSTAFELLRRGAKVTILDDGPIGGGETGRTSAHLASAVDDRYYVLEQAFGAGGAKIVAESHATAIDYIEAMVRELDIACDFRRVDGYLILPPGHHPDKDRVLERELAAAQRAGLPCELVDAAPLPFDTGPALRFPDQAELHPLKYLRGLAEAVVARGGHIHTGVHVEGIEAGEPVYVRLAGGRSLVARVVVDATNGAMSSHLRMHLRQAAYRSYVVGFRVDRGAIPHTLIWDTATPYHYLRVAPATADHEVLLVGGGDHRTGHGDPAAQWQELEAWTREWIPQAGAVVTRWSGQVIEPVDHLAHIGRSPEHDHVYVISGDSGNGLTHGTIAGLILPELMHGQRPRWARVYEPRRSHLRETGTLIKEAVSSSAPFLDWVRGGDAKDLDAIPSGEGALIRRGLHLYAAYRDPQGEPHLYNATCPHLRGVVHWNAAEKTWDCPCHGSRFDAYGRVVNGPAMANLSPVAPPPAPADRPERIEPERRREVPAELGGAFIVAPLERE